jgi:hypothetical protein
MAEEEEEDWRNSKNNTRSGPKYNLNVRNLEKYQRINNTDTHFVQYVPVLYAFYSCSTERFRFYLHSWKRQLSVLTLSRLPYPTPSIIFDTYVESTLALSFSRKRAL